MRKKGLDALEFNGEKYIVNNISNINDDELEFDYPIEVRNVIKDNEVSARNSKILIGYLNEYYGGDEEKVKQFFEENYHEHSYEFCNNTKNMMSYKNILKLHLTIQEATADMDPRSQIEMGKVAAKYQSMGPLLDAIGKTVSLKQFYWEGANYNRYFNNGQFAQSKYMDDDEIIVINKHAEYVRENLIVEQEYWTLGIFLGVSQLKNYPPCEGKLDYCLVDLEHLLDNEYFFLSDKITDHGFGFEELPNGLMRKIYFVDGVEHAHEIILEKEDFRKKARDREDAKVGTIPFAYGVEPKEFEEYDPKTLDTLLDDNWAAKGMLVTKPIIIEGYVLADEGEIFNMPYSRMTAYFPKRKKKISNLNVIGKLKDIKNRYYISKEAMETEMKALREEKMKSNTLAAERADLQAKLEIAGKIQQALLPQDITMDGFDVSAYMRSSEGVGGDYYDIIKNDGKNWAIIGDVSGHGISSSLIKMLAQNSIRLMIRNFPDIKPSTLLRLVNEQIGDEIRDMDENDKYMTINAISFDPENDKIRFSGMHEQMLLSDTDKGRVYVINTDGLWLSPWDLGRENKTYVRSFKKDDVLLLYTDGITEARDRDNNEFSIEKLERILFEESRKRPEAIKERILDELEDYVVKDDLTLLIIKRLGKEK